MIYFWSYGVVIVKPVINLSLICIRIKHGCISAIYSDRRNEADLSVGVIISCINFRFLLRPEIEAKCQNKND